MFNKFIYSGGVILVIRNGQKLKNNHDLYVSDISELSVKQNKLNNTDNINLTDKQNRKKNKRRISTGSASASAKINRFTEYLSGRKYYILILSFVYITGLLIGAVLVKNINEKEVFNLCLSMDNYFTDISSIEMTARIFGNIALNLVFLFGIYLCGITVFSPFICSAFCLYKGLSSGFITGVYLIGGNMIFHLAVCGISLVLFLFMTIFFILACGESMSFSSFLFKSEDNFKSNLSFKNISVYSSRNLVFLALITLGTVVQTIVIPVVYSILG